MLFQIKRTADGLRVEGEIDMASAPELAEAIARVNGSSDRLVIDVAGVTFMDSACLRLVLKEAMSRNGRGQVVLLHPTRPVRRLLDVSIPGGVPGLEVKE